MIHPAFSRTGLAAAVLVVACSGSAPTDLALHDESTCAQTYEFGNFGCAVVSATIDAPPTPWPSVHRLTLSARPARDGSGVSPLVATRPSFGASSLRVILWSPLLPAGTDTLSMWIVARMLDETPPILVGRPLPTFAADSALRLMRFAPVGARFVAEDVRLSLRRVVP